MARPPKEINWKIVEQKMKCGCTAKQIYNSKETQMSPDTFYDRFKKEFGYSFSDYSDASSEEGIGDIIYSLHTKAHNNKAPGNAQLLMFLAKCRAGYREPDVAATIAPKQDDIDKDHEIMMLRNELEKLKAGMNANQPQAE